MTVNLQNFKITMEYTIEKIDITNRNTELEIRQVIKAAFKSPHLLPENYLIKNIQSNASMPSFFLAAREKGEVIGCNAFLANDFVLNNKPYVGFQSCWSATHPDHQGKKVFMNMINEGKRILKDTGAGFLYGIANDNSNPIFIKKLGFIETPAVYVRILNIPFLKDSYFNKTTINANNSLIINEEQVEAYKRTQYPANTKIIRHKNSWVWGKIINKAKFGINIRAFYVGGIHISEENDFKYLINNLFKTHKVFAVQLTSCKSNSFNKLLKNWKPSIHMNGFIFFNLNMPDFEHLNLMIGAIDVF